MDFSERRMVGGPYRAEGGAQQWADEFRVSLTASAEGVTERRLAREEAHAR